MLLSRSSFTAMQQIKKNKTSPAQGMTEPMKVSGLPRGFANYPALYLVKCWSLVKGLSCQQADEVHVMRRHGSVLVLGCPHGGLQPVAQVAR